MTTRQSAYECAELSLSMMRRYAAQVEDGERPGDLGLLLAADAIVCALFAVIDAMPTSPA
jgi:hypothetical protein